MKLIQRQAVVLAAVLMAGLASVSLRAETTSVNNGSNSANVTQSGDPSKTEKQVETRPGYTSIEQRNGGNSATITRPASASTAVTTTPAPCRLETATASKSINGKAVDPIGPELHGGWASPSPNPLS